MYLIECAPITRGLKRETLSYFGKVEAEVGSVVSVPLRNKKVPALILKSMPLSEEKMAIKEAGFALRKLSVQKGALLYLKETVAAAEETAKFFAGSVGGILETFTPHTILESPLRIDAERKKGGRYYGRSLQAGIEERILEYRAIIRERFARDESVLLCAPTVEEVLFFSRELTRGIEKYSFALHSNLDKKEIQNIWKKATKDKHPVVIVTTPFGLSIPRGDIGSIIIERENSRGYLSPRSPYADGRHFAHTLAKHYKCQCIFADTTLRIETFYKEQQGAIDPFPSSKIRIQSSAKSVLIDTKKTDTGERKEFAVLSKEALEIIRLGIERNERIVIFAARKGIAPITSCGDCGTILECKECQAPMVLHERNDSFYFLCHRCGERQNSDTHCFVCGSWNMRPLGIGIDRVAEEIKKEFPTVKLHTMSKDHVRDTQRGKEIAEDFYRSPHTILLGTEFMVSYLQKPFEHTLIVSLDSLFSVPDFKIHEKIFNVINILRHLSTKTFILQTRNPSHFVLQSGIRGDMASFYREEIEKRKTFRFPPHLHNY